MKSETRLDSAVFQLTPTRTRYDLVIIANGKTEKIASGLLETFLAHLKTAQDQIAKGGYSIMLEPDPGTDIIWFTKSTVERFVRFVSTPEVLERVNTIESEILQIEEAIAIQGNENLGLRMQAEDHQTRSMEFIEGSKSTFDVGTEKAIVLYKPGARPPESNGSMTQEENSKVQLLRVLETRKTVLQKEQGMAFARAVAAGFDMDHMAHLISFAECFGAMRLLKACLRFMELWKGKHETGQWLEIEAAEAMSMRSDFMNASGVMLSGDIKKHEARPMSNGDIGVDNNGKAGSDAGAEQNLSSDHVKDRRLSGDPHVLAGPNEYFQGQVQHPMCLQWPMHSPPGAPVFQPYPMPGMPYYQNYPVSGPFFQPPYSQAEDPRFNDQQRMGLRKHSMESKDNNVESESWEMGVSRMRSQDDGDQNGSETEISQGRESHKKGGRLGKKQSGMVVIRNINYITKRHDTSGGENQSASNSETEEETEEVHSDAQERKHEKSLRSSKSKGSHPKCIETSNSYDKEEVTYSQEPDSGNWQAFQSFLLRDNEGENSADRDLFSGEKEPPIKRRQNKSTADPILPFERDSGDLSDRRMADFDTVNGKGTRMKKHIGVNGEQFHSSGGRGLGDNKLEIQFVETERGKKGYRRATSEDFMIYGRENQLSSRNSSDPVTENGYEDAGVLEKNSSYNVTDESFMVPVRSGSQENRGTDSRTAVDMDLEFPSGLQKAEDSSNRIKNQLCYEPDDLSLMPERGMERESIGYNAVMDYDMQVHKEDATTVGICKQNVPASTKEGLKRSDKEKRSRAVQDGLEKRKMDVLLRKGKPSKLSPPAEAQARAEKLRAFKADLQKEKKEREKEEIRRLEALKRERQKRIAARGSSNAAQLPLTPQQNRTHLTTKLSPRLHKGSKFSDSQPGSSSPLQKLPIRRNSVGSNESQKITRNSTLHGSKHMVGNGLSRSAPSLRELKKEGNQFTPETKTDPRRTRRLSDSKGSSVHRASSLKSASSDKFPRQNASDPKGRNIHRGSLLKPLGRGQVPNKNISDEPQVKKISAIMNLDKSKSATLPELKIRTSRGPSDAVQNKLTTKEAVQKGNKSTSSLSSETKVKKTDEKTSQLSNTDDNLIIEKKVVMLEHETIPVPVVQEPKKRESRNGSYGRDTGVKSEVVAEYAAVRAPASPIIICEVEKGSNGCQMSQQPESYKGAIGHPKDDFQKFNSTSTFMDKPYRAPYARATSLEDPCTRNLEYTEALPIISSETTSMGVETIKARVDSRSVEQIHEAFDKSQGKESSKGGFRRLLKFGRKSHGSGGLNADTDSSFVDHTAVVASTGEVHTLKKLISQDDTNVGGTPPKVSRPFSILSPFKTKTSEKPAV